MRLKRNFFAGNLRENNINEEVVLSGWVQKTRNLGSLIFIDLRDKTGISQIVFDEDVSKEAFETANKINPEYVISVKGIVRKRHSVNNDIPTGKIEVYANDIEVHNESITPPIYIKDDDNVSEDLRFKYRYLDLRKSKIQRNIITKHEIVKFVRNYLNNNDFLDIETPILTKATPEGARDYLVPSRVNSGKFFALPQSPQIFKQLLMIGGLDRYYQFARCFRDEDLRADRQPEFTQIDIEMSFVDDVDVMNFNEEMIIKLIKEIKGIDISTPIKKLSYKEAMDNYGSDKPDTRFGFKLKDLTDIFTNTEFKVFKSTIENNGMIKAININGYADKFSRKNIDALEKFSKEHGAKGLAWIKKTDGEFKSSVLKFLSDSEKEAIIEKMDMKDNDLILIVADKYSVVHNTLGSLRIKIANDLGLIEENTFDLLWVVNFPVLEFDEENNRYAAKHHPFTQPLDEDIELLEKDPSKARAKAYDLVLNGHEIGGGSIRIHKNEVQQKMFSCLGIQEEEANDKFGFLLEALKYGTPPHGGIAYGLDRLTMILTGETNIRQVIAFPKTQNASCPLTKAPSIIEEEQLNELSINIKNKNIEK